MQVSIRRKDLLSATEFFFDQKALILRVTDQMNRTVRFKTMAEADSYGNFYIKTRGMFKGRTTASYRLPMELGSLEELYGIVGQNLNYILRNLVERDRSTIARLRCFQTEG